MLQCALAISLLIPLSACAASTRASASDAGMLAAFCASAVVLCEREMVSQDMKLAMKVFVVYHLCFRCKLCGKKLNHGAVAADGLHTTA
jgi:hypothetical protein